MTSSISFLTNNNVATSEVISLKKCVKTLYPAIDVPHISDFNLQELKDLNEPWVIINGIVYNTTNLSGEPWDSLVKHNYSHATEIYNKLSLTEDQEFFLQQQLLGPYYGNNAAWYK